MRLRRHFEMISAFFISLAYLILRGCDRGRHGEGVFLSLLPWSSRCTCLSTPARYDCYPIIIELDSSEEIKVNEFDTMHFKGHASSVNHVTNEPLNSYATGYTFIFKGEPYMLVGIIYGEEEGEDLRADLDKQIDYMMTTVRTER